MQEMLNKISELKIVPVVKLDRASDAANLAHALIAGGLPVAEVTFRTDAAEESIRIMSQIPGMLVGAGTITSIEQAERAIAAGAQFFVTPGFSRKITEFALSKNMPIFPGVCTPSEIMSIIEYGLPVAKFFPAEQYGGVATIKALLGPFPNMKFMPTGGVSTKNILEYLAVKQIVACGGSWMVKDTLINEGKFDEITKMTREAVELVNGK